MSSSIDEPSHCENTDSCHNEAHQNNLSKKQLKRLKRKDMWLATKQERKQKEKEKLKLKKQAAAAAGINLPSRKRLKNVTMAGSNCHQRIAVDLSFDHLMSEKDLAKCIKQIHRCYSNNRRVSNPAQFHLTSFDGACQEVMEKNIGYQNWDINFHKQKYLDVFSASEIVYLTSDSDNVIEQLDDSKVYIIGGLVDHNGHKGLCHQNAIDSGVSHGRLPIGEYLNMKTSRVLTIDHVFQILLEVTQGKTWRDSFLSIIPSRKGAVIKDTSENENDKINTENYTSTIKNLSDDLTNDENTHILSTTTCNTKINIEKS